MIVISFRSVQVFEATVNRGGGAAGAAQRKDGACAFKCYICLGIQVPSRPLVQGTSLPHFSPTPLRGWVGAHRPWGMLASSARKRCCKRGKVLQEVEAVAFRHSLFRWLGKDGLT